ncbi:MAG: hypothetical protein HDT32_03840 [Clostridiales bacterium]|nr:hypothetical protein [Clostridiales bacterium]
MLTMKKSIATVLLVIMLVTLIPTSFSLLKQNEKTESKEITAVATSSEVQEVLPEEVLERAGIKLYTSEDEYIADQQRKASESINLMAEYESVPIWHTFTVKDRKTNKAISGAVIVIDGVPRFTDVSGQIFVKLTEEIVELRIEKEGYNPYVEFYDVYYANEEGKTEKTIYLKNPTDDMDIYNVTLDYLGEKANVAEQSYSFYKDDAYEDTIDISVEANGADTYYLYNGDTLIATSSDGNFLDLPVKDLDARGVAPAVRSTISQANDNIYLVTEKGGLRSRKTKIKVAVVELTDLPAEEYIKISLSDSLKLQLGETDFLGSCEIDIFKMLKEKLSINAGKVNISGSGLEVIHDNIRGSFQVVVGVKLDFKKDKKPKETKEEAAARKNENKKKFTSFVNSYKMRRDNINPKAKKQSVAKSLWGAFDKFYYKDMIAALPKLEKKMSLALNVVGYIEISDKVFTGEVKGKDGILSGGFNLELEGGVDFTKYHIVTAGPVPIPIYMTYGLGGAIEFDYDYEQLRELQHVLQLIVKFRGSIGGGVGIKQICSIGAYGKGEIDFLINILNGEDGLDIFLSFGVLVGILGYEIDWKIVDEKNVVNERAKMKYLSDNSNNNGTYMDARPQSVYINNEKLSVWIEKDDMRDNYNKTKLVYSYGDKMGSVLDDGKADYYPELKVIDNVAMVVWHKSTNVFDGESTIGDVFASSQIKVAQFNTTTGSFEEIKAYSLDTMSTLPKFVKNSTSQNMAIVWLNNTDNNPFGATGRNKLYCAERINSNWMQPYVIYETDSPISSFDATYMEGEINIAVSINEANDLESTDKLSIYYGKKNSLKAVEKVSQTMQCEPQFGNVNNSTVMFYYQDRSIKMLDIKNNTEKTIIQDSNLMDSYSVIEDVDSRIIYTIAADDSRELYLAQFDREKDSWTNGIYLDNNNNYIAINGCVVDSKIEIVGVTYEYSSNQNISIGEIKSESCELKADLGLDEAFMLDFVKLGDNEIYCFIKNKGCTNINEFKALINNEEQNVVLNQALLPNEERLIKIIWTCQSIPSVIDLKLDLINDGNGANDYTQIQVDYANIELNIVQHLKAGKESIALNINNAGYRAENAKVVIRRDNKNGEIVYESNEFIIQAGNNIEKLIELNYAELGCNYNDRLYIDIVTTNKQAISCGTAIIINEIVQPYNEADVDFVQDTLKIAKRVLGGVI